MAANTITTQYISDILSTYKSAGLPREQHIQQVIDVVRMENNHFAGSNVDENCLKNLRNKFLEGTYAPPSTSSTAPALYDVGAKIMFPVVSGSATLHLADEYAVNAVKILKSLLIIEGWILEKTLAKAFELTLPTMLSEYLSTIPGNVVLRLSVPFLLYLYTLIFLYI